MSSTKTCFCYSCRLSCRYGNKESPRRRAWQAWRCKRGKGSGRESIGGAAIGDRTYGRPSRRQAPGGSAQRGKAQSHCTKGREDPVGEEIEDLLQESASAACDIAHSTTLRMPAASSPKRKGGA